MSQSAELKNLRKQLRNIAKEILPEMMQHELYAKVERKMLLELNRRLDILDKRQSDLQNYMVRTTAIPSVKE